MAFKDPEKRKAYQRSWAADNRAKNPEAFREATRKYRAKNLPIIRKKDRNESTSWRHRRFRTDGWLTFRRSPRTNALVAFRHRRLNFQRLAVAQHRELGHVADKQERQPGA